MANVIACPACARRLSVNQALTPEQLLRCPVCRAVFALPAVDKVARRDAVDDRPRMPRSEGGFTERPPQPIKPRDDTPRRSSWPDDAEDDWPETGRPVKKEKSNRWLILALGGGFVVLVLVVGAIFYFVGVEADSVVGSWKGTFQFAFLKIDCTYQFRQDGIFVDEHIDPDIGVMVRATGRYKYANGRVTIQWDDGGFERASVRRTGPNTIEYVILAHSDGAQIGGKATFVRMTRRSRVKNEP